MDYVTTTETSATKGYRLFHALRRHFSSDYDFFKYNGKIKLPRTMGNEVFKYEKLGKHKDTQGIIVSNLIEKDVGWVGDLLTDEAERNYTDWLRRNQSLSYVFEQDLDEIHDKFYDLFLVKGGEHPPLYTMMRQKQIGIETFCILANITNAWKAWDATVMDPIIYPQQAFRLKKYTPFIQVDHDVIRRKIAKIFD